MTTKDNVAYISTYMNSVLARTPDSSCVDKATGRLIVFLKGEWEMLELADGRFMLKRGNDMGPIVGMDRARDIVWVQYMEQGFLQHRRPAECLSMLVSPETVNHNVRDVSVLGVHICGLVVKRFFTYA